MRYTPDEKALIANLRAIRREIGKAMRPLAPYSVVQDAVYDAYVSIDDAITAFRNPTNRQRRTLREHIGEEPNA